jgi:hypothetical protein
MATGDQGTPVDSAHHDLVESNDGTKFERGTQYNKALQHEKESFGDGSVRAAFDRKHIPKGLLNSEISHGGR